MAICGMGNVALDCARVLLQPPERLATTDIAAHALSQLHKSAAQRVDIIGRRGPAQVREDALLAVSLHDAAVTWWTAAYLGHEYSVRTEAT